MLSMEVIICIQAVLCLRFWWLWRAEREISMKDPLTGAWNRRALEMFWAKARAVCEREQSNRLALVVMDLNGFKQLNDTYGHQTGDAVLKVFSKAVANTLRGSDLLVRLGGDEFVAMIWTDRSEVESAVDRIKAVALSAVCEVVDLSDFGVSAGYAMGNYSLQDTLDKADQMMYSKKVARKL